MSVRPNFIILGAPKCGTSSLYNWLAVHPQITGSTRKETFVLMDKGNPLIGTPNIHDDGDAAFAPYFDAADTAPIRMEATTHTLFQQTALDVAAGWDDLRVAVVLREPASRVYSSFSFTQNNLGRVPAATSFADYLGLVDMGAPLFPQWVTHEGSAYVLERDLDYSRYATWLAPWIALLGRDRVRPILFEDMRRDPQGTVQGVVDWLGLDPVTLHEDDLATRNKTQAVRSPAVQKVMRSLNATVPLPRGLKSGLKSAYMAIQGKAPQTRSDRDEEALRSLRASFADDNARLAELCNWDLSVWQEASK